ncbi:unnamed protein product [Calypogeia fissa]
MSVRRKPLTRTTSMTRSLARSSSVSLVLPLAPQQPKSGILCTLRRAQSSIPAVEYCFVSSDFVTTDGNQINNLSKRFPSNQQIVDVGNSNFINKGDWDGEQDSYCSDYTSCSSSISDLLEVLDEPQRVSKDILRSLSISYQWLDLPLHEFELPTCREDLMTHLMTDLMSTVSVDQQTVSVDNGGQSMVGALPGPGLPVGRNGSIRFAYIHDCRTGRSLVSHVELKTAMDNLGHWTMQVPRNCCLSYRHDSSGEVATLPWPDLEAGGMDEVEDFVSTVNRIEGRPVFFPRYERSPFQVEKSLYTQTSLRSQKSTSSHSFSSRLPPLAPPSTRL